MKKENKIYEVKAKNGLLVKTVYNPNRKDNDSTQWQQIDNNIVAILQNRLLIDDTIKSRFDINECLKNLLIETKKAKLKDFEDIKPVEAKADTTKDQTQIYIDGCKKLGHSIKKIKDSLKATGWNDKQINKYFPENAIIPPLPPLPPL